VSRRGATLLELTVTVTVLAIIASALAPVVNAAVDAYGSARNARSAAESATFALDRCTRVLREAPAGAAPGAVGITTASTARVTLADGSSIELVDDEVQLSIAGATAPIATGVTDFELRYLGEDGVSSTIGSPEDTHSVQIRIVVGGMELRGVAFCRVRIGS